MAEEKKEQADSSKEEKEETKKTEKEDSSEKESKVVHECDCSDPDCDCKKMKSKLQNYLAVIILFAGLFVGSLFVDVMGLVRGEGISLKKIQNSDVFTAGGKTWVKFNEPIINLTVVTDKDCKEF